MNALRSVRHRLARPLRCCAPLVVAVLCFVCGRGADAAYVTRYSAVTNGAITFTGNTLGLNKAAGLNAPGTTGSIGAFTTTDTLQQVGTYPAGTTAQWQQNSSTAVLTIPAGSTVVYAELIWGGSYSYGGQDVSASLNTAVTLTTPAGSYAISPTGATSQNVGTAGPLGTCTTGPCEYVRSQNVTAQVLAGGAGSYTVGGVPGTDAASENNSNTAGWTLAVVYSNSNLPARSLTVFVGAETGGNPPASISGFCTNTGGARTGRLQVSAMEGDSGITGDQMMFGPTASTMSVVSGPNNAAGNFFASQINGDTGTLNTAGTFGGSNQPPNAFATGRQGYDITNVDVSSFLNNSQTTAFAQGTTTGDQYVINALGLQINVGSPKFPTTAASVNKTTTYVGDTLTYTVLIDNTSGTADATNVTITDAPPPGTTYVANSFAVGGITVAGAAPASGVNVGTVAAGSSKTVTFSVAVNAIPASPAAAQYADAASWTYQYVSCTGQPAINGTFTTNTVITTVPRIEPTKTVAPTGSVTPGQTLTYTISMPNTGTTNTAGSTLQDTIPAGTTYLAGSTTLNGSAVGDVGGAMPYATAATVNSPTRAAGQINAGETATVVFKVTVNAASTGPITNTAAIDADGAGPMPPVTAQASSAVVHLVSTKTVSPTGAVAPGQTLTYTITVQNTGNGPSSGTTLADPIPAGLSYVPGSTTQNGSAVADILGAMPYVNAAPIKSPSGGAGVIVSGETATLAFKVTVNAAPGAGPLINTATIDPDGAGPAVATTVAASSAVVLPDLSLSKSHVGSFVVGTVGSYTLQVATLANQGQVTSGPVTVTDSLPTGMTVAALPTGTNWDCTASVVGSATATCNYSGAFPIPPGTALAPITVTVNVAAAAAPAATNSAAVAAVPGETYTANNTATDPTVVIGKPTITKAFSVVSIPVGGTATLTLTLANPNNSALTGVNFSDTFPGGLVIAAVPSLTNSCGGSVSGGTAGATSVALSGGTLNAVSSCVVSMAVSAAVAGSYVNTASGVTSTESGSAGTPSNTATLTVLGPPTIDKTFTPNPVAATANSTLTITLTNPYATALVGTAFTDNYPANLRNTALPTIGNTCGGTVNGAALGTALALSGGIVPPNGSCTVSITVNAPLVGSYVNTTGAVSSSNGGTGQTATATLIVASNPTISKAFSPSRVSSGASSTLTLTLANGSVLAQTGVAFSDAFPPGLVVAGSPALSNTCGGSVSGATAGSTSIALNGGAINANSTCVVSVAVQAPAPGNYANTTGPVSSTQSGTLSGSNTATLQVVGPASIAKSFSPSTILSGGTSTLSLVIGNPNGIALTGLAFSDPFPANLVITNTPTATNNCGGTLTGAAAGSTALSLAGGSLPAGPGTTCTIIINVTSATPGSLSNTASGVSSNEAVTGSSSNASILIATAPDLKITKTHSGKFVVGTLGTYTLSVDNTLGNGATTGNITVTDTLPTGLGYVAAGSGGSGWACGASGQLVTCTSTTTLAAGATAAPITLNVSVAAPAVPNVTNNVNVSGGGEPAVNANNNAAADYTLVENAPQSTLSTDGGQTSTPGTIVFYPHIFTAGYAGSVAFGTTDAPNPTIGGWSSTLFRDTNCNGVLDGAEGATPLTGSLTVTAGAQVCIIVKVFIPAVAPYNAQDQTSVNAVFTASGAGQSSSLTRTDLTLVGGAGGAGLSLQKTVRNVSTGESANANDSASSGQTLEYAIQYVNNSASALNGIVINDVTPSFTRFLSALCVTPLPAALTACSVSTQPAVNAQGPLMWTLNGSLQSGATGSVQFRVTVQ